METRLHLSGADSKDSTLLHVTVWFRDNGNVEIESTHDRSSHADVATRFSDVMTVDEFERRLIVPSRK